MLVPCRDSRWLLFRAGATARPVTRGGARHATHVGGCRYNPVPARRQLGPLAVPRPTRRHRDHAHRPGERRPAARRRRFLRLDGRPPPAPLPPRAGLPPSPPERPGTNGLTSPDRCRPGVERGGGPTPFEAARSRREWRKGEWCGASRRCRDRGSSRLRRPEPRTRVSAHSGNDPLAGAIATDTPLAVRRRSVSASTANRIRRRHRGTGRCGGRVPWAVVVPHLKPITLSLTS